MRICSLLMLAVVLSGCARKAVERPHPEAVLELEQWAKAHQFHVHIEAWHHGEETEYHVRLWPQSLGSWPRVAWVYLGLDNDLAKAVQRAKDEQASDQKTWYYREEGREVLSDK